MSDEIETRTLLVDQGAEKFKITIPADWKVTFGKPLGGRGFDSAGDERELRLYESGTQQRACFTRVKSFRDLSIPLVRLVRQESGETNWEDDGEGNVTATRKKRTRVREVAA